MSGSAPELHCAGAVQLADLIGGLGALSPCFVALAAADAMRPGTPLLVAGAAHDDRLATYHARARALRNASLVSMCSGSSKPAGGSPTGRTRSPSQGPAPAASGAACRPRKPPF